MRLCNPAVFDVDHALRSRTCNPVKRPLIAARAQAQSRLATRFAPGSSGDSSLSFAGLRPRFFSCAKAFLAAADISPKRTFSSSLRRSMRYGPGGPLLPAGAVSFVSLSFMAAARISLLARFLRSRFPPECQRRLIPLHGGRLLLLAGLRPCFFHPRSAAQHAKPGDLGDLSDLYQIRAASRFTLYRAGGHTAPVPTPRLGTSLPPKRLFGSSAKWTGLSFSRSRKTWANPSRRVEVPSWLLLSTLTRADVVQVLLVGSCASAEERDSAGTETRLANQASAARLSRGLLASIGVYQSVYLVRVRAPAEYADRWPEWPRVVC